MHWPTLNVEQICFSKYILYIVLHQQIYLKSFQDLKENDDILTQNSVIVEHKTISLKSFPRSYKIILSLTF